MNRDNALFLVIGLLLGFISGYLVHEVMAARQPPRAPVGHPAGMTGMGGNGAGTAMPPAAGGTPGGGPPMEEILRLRDHVEANPEDAESVLLLANLNYDIRSWERAGGLYRQYLDLRPESPDVLTDLGVTYRERGMFDEALGAFQAAQELEADHWQSLFNTVVVYAFDLRDFDRANEVLERLSALQPDNPDVQRLAEEVARRAGASA